MRQKNKSYRLTKQSKRETLSVCVMCVCFGNLSRVDRPCLSIYFDTLDAFTLHCLIFVRRVSVWSRTTAAATTRLWSLAMTSSQSLLNVSFYEKRFL